ncbi:MAG: hypothetical protein ABSH51_21635 [Solirubrobacteraceae bacterium]
MFVQARDVRASAIEFALQLGALTHELVAFEQKHLVLAAEAVAFVFDPGPVGLSELSGEIADEPPLGCDLATELAGSILGVECSLAPRCFLLGGDRGDGALGAGLAAGLRCGDDRPGLVVLVGEGS